MRPVWVVAIVAGGCQVVSDFTLTPVPETSDLLCGDTKDNDFNGLVDCQDWNCLTAFPCCDIPQLILVDDFDYGPADCADPTCAGNCTEPVCGPDPERWHTWPCPYPIVCGDAMHLNKTECFAGGVLAKAPLSLEPGLRIEVEIVGQPERRGYVEIALTQQDESDFPGSLDTCGSFQRVNGFISVTQEFADGGYRLVALLRGDEVGQTDVVTDPDLPHTVGITIESDRRIAFAIDGAVFATAPEPLPVTDDVARLVLSGLTENAAFAGVRVQAGIRCHDPTSWELARTDLDQSVALAGDESNGLAFDSDEVFLPSVRLASDTVDLFYTGCRWIGTEECDPLQIALGRARSTAGGPFVRDTANPLVVLGDIPSGALSGRHNLFSIDLLPGDPLRGFLSSAWNDPIFTIDQDVQPADQVVVGAFGGWDYENCCPAGVEGPNDTLIVWYSGRGDLGVGVWQIGAVISTDGGKTFVSHPDNPVFGPGPPGSFDSEGVLSPTVVYDEARGMYRMWYEGQDFFGETRIGYAVSVDGLQWSRSPEGPAVVAAELGLETIGGPEVLLRPDGRLEMWVHGSTLERPQRRIYHLRNDGRIPQE